MLLLFYSDIINLIMNICIKFAEPPLQVPLETLQIFKVILKQLLLIIIIIILSSKVPFHIKLVYQTIMYLC